MSHSSPLRRRIIVFTRYSETGRVKTRLIPAIGPHAAADVHRRLTIQTLATARRAAGALGCSLVVEHDGDEGRRLACWLGPDLEYRRQANGDLGVRMREALHRAFAEGCDEAILIGSDLPYLTETHLRRAFDAFADNDLVLGPALDGGYYLIGLNHGVRRQSEASTPLCLPAQADSHSARDSKDHDSLFDAFPWGTADVLQQTLRAAENARLKFTLLDPLADVDRPEDLPQWESAEAARREKAQAKGVSIIIPARNEAHRMGPLLAELLAESAREIIVVDGESADSTREVAAAYGATVLQTAAGRARQMNAGAQIATGEILLFLHADTRLPARYGDLVTEALTDPRVACWAFAFRTDGRSPLMRVIEWGTNLRSRYLRLPYGDQALFVRASLFHRIGGFPDLPIMEDVALVRRLRRLGRVVTLPSPVITSARRWEQRGILRTTATHLFAIAAYSLGMQPKTIAAILRRFGYFGGKS